MFYKCINYHKPATEKVHLTIANWISSFNPSHFLTIKLSCYAKNKDRLKSDTALKSVLRKSFSKSLYSQKLCFIGCAEKGKSELWHYHLFIYNCQLTTEQLEDALYEAQSCRGFYNFTFDLQPIKKNLDKVCDYAVKEIIADKNFFFDSRLITSHDMFSLPVKKCPVKPAAPTMTEPAHPKQAPARAKSPSVLSRLGQATKRLYKGVFSALKGVLGFRCTFTTTPKPP